MAATVIYVVRDANFVLVFEDLKNRLMHSEIQLVANITKQYADILIKFTVLAYDICTTYDTN